MGKTVPISGTSKKPSGKVQVLACFNAHSKCKCYLVYFASQKKFISGDAKHGCSPNRPTLGWGTSPALWEPVLQRTTGAFRLDGNEPARFRIDPQPISRTLSELFLCDDEKRERKRASGSLLPGSRRRHFDLDRVVA